MSSYDVVGKAVKPLDGIEKVTGALVYAVDKKVAGMLHGKILRSQYPKAEILGIDASKALALPGVYGILTHEDVPQRNWNGCWFNYVGTSLDGKPRFYLDEIGVVVAETPELAERATELIEVEYKPLPAVFTIEDARKENASQVRPEGTNCRPDAVNEWGDIVKGETDSDYIEETEMYYNSQQYAPIGRNACIAEWENGCITVYTSTQTPSELKAGLSEACDIPESRVRVITQPGGSSMGIWWSNNFMMLTALAAKKFHRPVRIELSTEECFATVKRRHMEHSIIKMGCDSEGHLLLLDGVHYIEMGGYCWKDRVGGQPIDLWGKTKNGRTCHRPVTTNLVTAGCMRGVGELTFSNAIERTADKLAERAGLDPVEFRLLNQIKKGDRFRYFSGEYLMEDGLEGYYSHLTDEQRESWPDLMHLTSGGTENLLLKGRELFDWENRWKGWKTPTRIEGPVRRGIGAATGIHCNGVEDDGGVNSVVRVNRDGSAVLYCNVGRTGSYPEQTQLQIMAETLGLPIEQCVAKVGDTDSAPFAHGSIASNSTHRTGWATKQAALDAKSQILKIASHEFFSDHPAEDLEIKHGYVKPKDGNLPVNSVSVQEVLSKQRSDQLGCTGSVTGRTYGVMPPSMHYSRQFAAQFAEVEVNTDTGVIHIIDYLAVQDSGVAINPDILRNQVFGGIMAGLGFALSEELVIDLEKGKILNPNFLDYKVLRIADFPTTKAQAFIVEDPCPVGPYGARGAGESPIAASVPTICQAVYNAIGVWVELPMTPERVLKALSKY